MADAPSRREYGSPLAVSHLCREQCKSLPDKQEVGVEMWTTKKQTGHRSGGFSGDVVSFDPLTRIAKRGNSMRHEERGQRIITVDVKVRVD